MLAYTFYEADNRVRRYAETLVKRGDQVEAIALRRDGQARFEVIRGVRVHRIQNRRIDEKGPFSYLCKLSLFFFRSMFFLALHSRPKYDLIHVHSVPDFEVFATIVPRLLGTRVILDIHDIVPEFYASKFKVNERSYVFRLLILIEKLSCAYCHKVIISNHLWRDRLVQRSVPSGKCFAIINYPDTSIFRPVARQPKDTNEFLMCYPGTLNRHQGLDVAIRAVALLRDKLPGLKFLIIGDGPDREKLKEMVKNERLEDRVTIKGFVTLETVADIMSTVDLGVVPKRKDSFGNEAFSTKIMEFMAMGVPVVVSNTRIDQYYFSDKLVQFFESDDPRDLADQIATLAANPDKRHSLAVSATEFITQNNWKVKSNEYLVLIDSLFPQRPAQGMTLSRA